MTRQRRLLAAVGVAAAAVAILLDVTGALSGLERRTQDQRIRIGAPHTDTGRIVIVGMDARSEAKLGTRFPVPRSVHARMLDRLRAAGPAAIAFDVQFSGVTKPREDAALRAALARAPGTVLASAEFNLAGQSEVLGGPDAVAAAGARVADSSLPFDDDGVFRRLRFAPHGPKAFAIAVAEQMTHHPVSRSAVPSGGGWIAYQGGPGTVRRYSYADVLDGSVPASALRGRAVIVGATDPIQGDVHRTPISDDLMPGPEIQANAVATVLARFPLKAAPAALDLLLILAMAALGPVLATKLGPWPLAAAVLAAFVGLLVLAQLAFQAGVIVAVAVPAAALILGSAGAFGVKYVTEIRERRRMRQLFSRFVPEEVVDLAVAADGADLRSGAESLEATVMFADLRGFTRFAEGKAPDVVSDVLNRYLTEMSTAIQRHDGTVVSYMGDGIMAVFGAPVVRPDHAASAVAAARDMVGPSLRAFNDWLGERGLPAFRMGVGVSTGQVMAGNVGSGDRVGYTALGDTTNLGARLEAMTKETGHAVLMSEATRDLVDPAETEHVGELPIRGREAPCRVWALKEP